MALLTLSLLAGILKDMSHYGLLFMPLLHHQKAPSTDIKFLCFSYWAPGNGGTLGRGGI